MGRTRARARRGAGAAGERRGGDPHPAHRPAGADRGRAPGPRGGRGRRHPRPGHRRHAARSAREAGPQPPLPGGASPPQARPRRQPPACGAGSHAGQPAFVPTASTAAAAAGQPVPSASGPEAPAQPATAPPAPRRGGLAAGVGPRPEGARAAAQPDGRGGRSPGAGVRRTMRRSPVDAEAPGLGGRGEPRPSCAPRAGRPLTRPSRAAPPRCGSGARCRRPGRRGGSLPLRPALRGRPLRRLPARAPRRRPARPPATPRPRGLRAALGVCGWSRRRTPARAEAGRAPGTRTLPGAAAVPVPARGTLSTAGRLR